MARPTKCTPEVVELLEDAFRDGASITEACLLAHIDRVTYYSWIKTVEGFSSKMQDAQDWVNEVARAVVAKHITKRKDVDTAKWWLERRVKDKFAQRSELTGANGKDLPTPIFGGLSQQPVTETDALSEDNSN